MLSVLSTEPLYNISTQIALASSQYIDVGVKSGVNYTRGLAASSSYADVGVKSGAGYTRNSQ